MQRKLGAWALIALATFMFLGFMRSSGSLASPATLFALLITVALPAAGGIALLRGAIGGSPRERMEKLRQQTIEAEILRMALEHKGRLTVVEVASALALPGEQVQVALDALVRREVADLDFTDDGVVYYTFHDAKHVTGTRAADSARLLDG